MWTRIRRLTVNLCAAAFLFVTFGHFVQHHIEIGTPGIAAVVTATSADTAGDTGDTGDMGKIGHAGHCHTCSTTAMQVSHDVGFSRAIAEIPQQVALPLVSVSETSDGPPPRS